MLFQCVVWHTNGGDEPFFELHSSQFRSIDWLLHDIIRAPFCVVVKRLRMPLTFYVATGVGRNKFPFILLERSPWNILIFEYAYFSRWRILFTFSIHHLWVNGLTRVFHLISLYHGLSVTFSNRSYCITWGPENLLQWLFTSYWLTNGALFCLFWCKRLYCLLLFMTHLRINFERLRICLLHAPCIYAHILT